MPSFNPEVDYYAILQVHPNAHLEVIKRAYRTIIGLLQSHPDLGGSHEQAVQVNEAYAVLSDASTRKAYDDARRQREAAQAASAMPYGPQPPWPEVMNTVVDSRHRRSSSLRSVRRAGCRAFIAIISAAGPQVKSSVCW